MDKETNNNESLQLFEDQAIRTAWDEQNEEWYFSIVDVVGVLTESPNPNNYWKVLKKRLKEEGNESVTNCNQLKLKSPKDGKRYATDVANTEQLLRIIHPFPPKKQNLSSYGWRKSAESALKTRWIPNGSLNVLWRPANARAIPASGLTSALWRSAHGKS